MRKYNIITATFFFLACISFTPGCGYTTRSLLPPNYKTIYVESFENKIPIAAETTEDRMYRGYRPGMETDITRAVIDRFLLDGNLRVANDPAADLVLKGELVDFRREALRYDANDNVVEYRLLLFVNLELTDTTTGKLVWREKIFAGETSYQVSGSLAKSETDAVKDATADLARRIVERTVEAW